MFIEAFYTVEWERRIFKKIGEYLRKNNLTIHKCFNMIDEDNSQTISIDELRSAVIRFQLNISDKELKVFLQRLDEDNKGYIT
jgi:Ca2+-binding EF-hand superfamily protein